MGNARRVSLVVAGGMLGSLVRDLALTDAGGGEMRLIAVNIAGGAIAGWLVGRVPHHSHRARWLLPLAVVGVAGALTTFSTLAVDSVMLAEAGRWGDAAWLTAAALGLGPVAAGGGMMLGRRT